LKIKRREKMKKRKNIIISAITCMMSICLMMFGVYSATNPSVSINGQVSYTARDAKVLVQGKLNGAKNTTDGTQMATVDYPTATVTTNDVTAEKVTNSTTQYLDYTAGTGNSDGDDLSKWSIGEHQFYEDNTGVKDIVISFKLTNLSTYPVKASITFDKDDTALANANVKRTSSATEVTLSQNGGNSEVTITYSVVNDGLSVTATDLLNMNIKFEKTIAIDGGSSAGQVVGYTFTEQDKSNGYLELGQYSDGHGTCQWYGILYSTDGETFVSNTNGVISEIPENAKYVYFMLCWEGNTELNSNPMDYLSSEKYEEIDGKYYIKAGQNGVTSAGTVYANDYYYSDIRSKLKSCETYLNIDTNSDVYKSIVGRTVKDLYSNMASDGTALALPNGANENAVDKFWIVSAKESMDSNDYFYEYWYTMNAYRTPVDTNKIVSGPYDEDTCSISGMTEQQPLIGFMLKLA
jgi:hypothetical protein